MPPRPSAEAVGPCWALKPCMTSLTRRRPSGVALPTSSSTGWGAVGGRLSPALACSWWAPLAEAVNSSAKPESRLGPCAGMPGPDTVEAEEESESAGSSLRGWMWKPCCCTLTCTSKLPAELAGVSWDHHCRCLSLGLLMWFTWSATIATALDC